MVERQRRIQLGGRDLPGVALSVGWSGPRPTVVLAGGWCYVREVVMPTYAAAFAAAGLNALVFDYRNLGVSDGDNRQHLDPWAQIRDYQNAISFLERHKAVDAHRIGVGVSPIGRPRPCACGDGSASSFDRQSGAGHRRLRKYAPSPWHDEFRR